MAKFPALVIWTDALLADTTHLSHEEFGIYTRILIHLWRAPGQKFPNDDAWLARKFGCRSAQDYENTVFPIIREFCQCDGNWWRQKRLSKEFKRAKSHSHRQSDLAKSRWRKEKDVCQGIARAGNARAGNAPVPYTKKIDNLNGSFSLPRVRAASGATPGSEQKKALWEQKAVAWMQNHWPAERVAKAVQGYLEGTEFGKAEYECADREMRGLNGRA